MIEGTDTTFRQIGKEFGPQVARGVLALSKDPAIDLDERLSDSIRRIRLESKEVWMVKLADRITNLQLPAVHWTKDKIVAYTHEANEILTALGSASRILAERLALKIDQYKAFQKP